VLDAEWFTEERMKNHILVSLVERYPALESCAAEIEDAFKLLCSTFERGGKVLTCGNGGSAADAEHIVGELMKGFQHMRPVPDEFATKLTKAFPEEGVTISRQLQRGLPSISLVNQTSLGTAISNDVSPGMVFAQQVYGYGEPGDTLLCLSTSGNSLNVVRAVQVAHVMGLTTVGMTGQSGGRLAELCSVVIRVPETRTRLVQEYHLPVYHALCLMLEKEFFQQ
jgi:D-sedoheptulose 7-phosphate isomerase